MAYKVNGKNVIQIVIAAAVVFAICELLHIFG